MKMPRIDDKEAVPVRALPHLTQFHPLAPDKVALLLAENDRRHKWTIRAYQRSHDGALIAWPPRQWDAVFARLEAEAARIRASGTSLAEQDVELDDRLVAVLPAGVFLWRDELEAEYQRTFGRMGPFPSIKPDAPDLEPATQRVFALIDSDPNGELEAALDAEQTAIEGATRYRAGDGVLDIDSTPDPDAALAAVIYEGFEDKPRGRDEQRPAAKTEPTMRAQERLVVEAIRSLGLDPMALPQRKTGKRWVKSEVRAKVGAGPSNEFGAPTAFDATWDRLRADGEIKEI